MSQTFEVIATKDEKKNYIMNKIRKLESLSNSFVGSRNTAEALAILDNLSKIGITLQEEQQVNRILKNNSSGFLSFGRRIPNFKYSVETPFQDYYLKYTQSQQQMRNPLYIETPTNVKMNNKFINNDSFKKQNINDFPNASIRAAPKPTQKSVQEIIQQFKERNRRSKEKQRLKRMEKQQTQTRLKEEKAKIDEQMIKQKQLQTKKKQQQMMNPNQLLKLKMKQRRNLMDYDYQNDDDDDDDFEF